MQEGVLDLGELLRDGAVDLAIAPKRLVDPPHSSALRSERTGFAPDPVDVPGLVVGDRTQHFLGARGGTSGRRKCS